MAKHDVNLKKPWSDVERYVLFEPMPLIWAFLSITVLRPLAVFWAGAIALVGLMIFGWTAQEIGFGLSGSEVWVLLFGGWVFGLLFELILKMIRR